NSSEGKIIPAIQAMNSVLEEYPKDKMLAWLGGIWIENQQQITRAIPIFERAIKLDPNFAAPLNELGYCYAAFATLTVPLPLCSATSPCCPMNPTRKTPMLKSCAWLADLMMRWCIITSRSRLTVTSGYRNWASPILTR